MRFNLNGSLKTNHPAFRDDLQITVGGNISNR